MKVRSLQIAIAVALSATPLCLPAYAQGMQRTNENTKQSAKHNQRAKPQRLQTVIVTGTRALDRTATDSTSPIDVLTPQQLKATGATSLIGALRQLLPSFYSAMNSLNDAAVGVQPAELRGLSPNETLVLINGKVQHHSAVSLGSGADTLGTGFGGSPIDLAAIPINAVKRIEVLRDGAATQYGSSAIAGVINIILKGGPGEHGSAYAQYGQWGHNGDTWKGGADTGFDLGNAGWIHLSVDYLHQDYANRAGPDRRHPGDPAFGTVDMILGIPREMQKQFALNMQYKLGEDARFYAFDVFNKRRTQDAGGFRLLSTYATTSPAAVTVYPDGFLPFENQSMLDNTAVLGIKGTALGWHYDFSGDIGSSHWKLNTFNTFNYSLGTASPTAFYIGTLVYHNKVFNADFRRHYSVGMTGPLTVAWGVQFQNEKFTQKHGGQASYFGGGAQVFPGFQLTDAISATRQTLAEYVDVEGQVSDKLYAAVAGRNVHNNQFGNDVIWKASGIYNANPTFAVRGTVGTGFASPTMQEVYYQTTGNSFIPTGTGAPEETTVVSFRNNSPVARAMGALPLTPEKSLSYGLGLVITPQVGPYVTLDAYQITLRNRILKSGALVGPAVASFLQSKGFTGVQGGSFFTNAVKTRTRGVDLVATWPIQFERSQLKLTLGGNWNKTEVLSVAPNPPQLALHGLSLPIVDRAVIGSLEDGTPRTHVSLSAAWTKGRWTVNGRVTRYGQWSAINKWSPAADQTFGSRVVPDASVTYNVHRWRFAVGGNNFTNTVPGRVNAASNFGGVITYPISSPFGYIGAFWYVRAGYSW